MTGNGTRLEQVCLRPAGRVWAPDFVQERFHNTSPGDLASTLIKGAGKQGRA